jgi:hypothetical protein
MPWRRCIARWHTRYLGSGCTAGVCEGAPTVCSRASNLITGAGRRVEDPAAAWTRDVQLTHRPPILVVGSMQHVQRQGPRRVEAGRGGEGPKTSFLRALQRSLAGSMTQRASFAGRAWHLASGIVAVASWQWHHRAVLLRSPHSETR